MKICCRQSCWGVNHASKMVDKCSCWQMAPVSTSKPPDKNTGSLFCVLYQRLSEGVRVRQCVNPQPRSRHFGLLTVQTVCAPGGVPYGTVTGPQVTFVNSGLGTTMSKCEVKPSAARCGYKGPLYFQSRLRKTLMQHIYVYTVNTCKDAPDVPDVGETNNEHPS